MNFLKTKMGMLAVAIAVLCMAFAFYSVQAKKKARQQAANAPAVAAAAGVESKSPQAAPVKSVTVDPAENNKRLAAQMSSMDGYRRYDSRNREDKARNGMISTKRETANKPRDAGREQEADPQPPESTQKAIEPRKVSHLRLRLSGVGSAKIESEEQSLGLVSAPAKAILHEDAVHPQVVHKPTRFNPYGRPIKCELVFTIDSTMEQTPLIGLVVEPVYNNGKLVIPASTELHGVARPDRQRDRIFSGQEWYMIFPREAGKPNGRQLKIKGLVLDRIEPDANGMTWGITDGSYGLQGAVIKTSDAEEVKQFAATALAAVATSLQDTRTNAYGTETIKNTPRNAALAGVGSSMELLVKKIQEEIDKNGTFIRVPGGKQFYFYPQQIIDPDLADISTDIAPVQ